MNELPLKVGPDGVEAEPKKTGHRHTDLIVAGAAILISLISLGIAVKHGMILQNLVASNSWPLVQYETGNAAAEDTTRPQIWLRIENAGIGPALIRQFSVSYQGRTYQTPEALLAECCGWRVPSGAAQFEPGNAMTEPVEGQVIRPGESLVYLAMEPTAQNMASWSRLNQARHQLSFDVCYCNVFDDCWRSTLRGLDAQAVKSCPGPRS